MENDVATVEHQSPSTTQSADPASSVWSTVVMRTTLCFSLTGKTQRVQKRQETDRVTETKTKRL